MGVGASVLQTDAALRALAGRRVSGQAGQDTNSAALSVDRHAEQFAGDGSHLAVTVLERRSHSVGGTVIVELVQA